MKTCTRNQIYLQILKIIIKDNKFFDWRKVIKKSAIDEISYLKYLLQVMINIYFSNRQMSETKIVFWGSNQHNLLSPSASKSFNRPQHISLPYDIVDISASQKHITFITSDGSLYSYGINIDGRLGVGGRADLKYSVLTPTKVKLNTKAIKVKCGFSHVCVQLSNDELYAWGLGDYGSLGTGQFKSKALPSKVNVKGRITNFSCGAMHSGFVDSEGNIFTCGSNQYGQLGVNKPEKISTPMLVNFNHKVKQIECGVFYTLLLTTKGQVYGMGNNKYGQLGIGHKVNECHPTLIRELQNITMIAAGYHSGAVDKDGNLYIWGSGSFGQLLKPKKITLPTPVDYLYIRGFFGISISSGRDRRVYSWGNNTYGQLGRGNYESAKDPIELQDLANLRLDNFACGVNFFLATSKDDRVSTILSEERIARENKFLVVEKEQVSRRSPYNYGTRGSSLTPRQDQITRRPLNYDPAGSSTFRYDDSYREYAARSRNRSNQLLYRSPERPELQVADIRLRSRSRQQREAKDIIIEQQIRRSRNRSRNYEELFVSLSADYETLLARYKALEDHLQLKNRSLASQKQELSLLFKTQNDALRGENDFLKRQLASYKQQIAIYQNKIISFQAIDAPIHNNSKQVDFLKKEIESLQIQLSTARQQLKSKPKASNDEQFKYTPKKTDSKKNNYEQQKEIDQLKEQNSKLAKELRNLKEQFKITIAELEDFQQQSSLKDNELRELRQKKSVYQDEISDHIAKIKELETISKQYKINKEELRQTVRRLEQAQEEIAIKSLDLKDLKQKKSGIDIRDQYQSLKKELSSSLKDQKILKDQIKSNNKKYAQLQEQLAIRNIQLKDMKLKKQTIQGQLRQQIDILNQQMAYLSKEMKITKDQLKITLKKLDSTEQQLAIKSLEVKDLKQKRLIYDATEQLKNQIISQRDEITILSKQNKGLKEEIKSNLRKLDQFEEELAIKSLQAKDSKQKLVLKDQQVEILKSQVSSFTKQNKDLKDSLKKTLKQADTIEQQLNKKKAESSSVEKNLKFKIEEVKQLQKKIGQLEDQYREVRTKKDLQIQNGIKKIENIAEELMSIKLREMQLSQNLKESQRTSTERQKFLSEKEKQITNLVTSQKRMEAELYKSIGILEEQKNRLADQYDKCSIEKKHFEQSLRLTEQNFYNLEKQYQQELNETYGNLVKLKEVQDLNEIRAGELKTIIQTDKKVKGDLVSELQMLRVQSENLQQEKQQLFKMLDEIKAKQADNLKGYKDRIIELENILQQNNERVNHMQVELNYEKDYHSKCEFTIKDLNDNRDKVCKQNQHLKTDLQKEKDKVKELSYEIQKNKTYKKEIQVLTLQLERVESSSKQFKKQIEEVLLQKEEIIKQQRNDLEKKQKEVDRLEEKYDVDVGALNRQVKDWQKKMGQRNKDYNDLKKQLQKKLTEIDNLKDGLDKTQRKLAFKNDELQKEMKQHQRTTEEFNNLRRQYTRLKSEKEQLQNKNEDLEYEKKVLEGKISERKKQIELHQADIKRLEATCDNLRKETEISKKQLEESNWALEESNRVNDELSKANKQFAENQEQFTSKIRDLEGRIFQLEDENKSYTPRYEALMQRNKELDERNRQLSQMINKAIQMQAEAYKTNILKEVEINTGQIIQQIKEQQQFKAKGRRRQSFNKQKDNSKLQIQNLPASSELYKQSNNQSKIKDEPYTKLMNEKIGVHKKKISDSAQKLAGILDLHGRQDISDIADRHSDGKQFSRSINIRREQDYEKINSQMESLNQQKHQFMQKISSFAQKLKIL